MVGRITRALAMLGAAYAAGCSGGAHDDAPDFGALVAMDGGGDARKDTPQGWARAADAGRGEVPEDASDGGADASSTNEDATLGEGATDAAPDVPLRDAALDTGQDADARPQDARADAPPADARPDAQDARADVSDGATDATDATGTLALGCGPGERYEVRDLGQHVHDHKTGLNWTRTKPPTLNAWQAAKQWCEMQGKRLPTLAELQGVTGAEDYAACAWEPRGWGSWSSGLVREAGQDDRAYYVQYDGVFVLLPAATLKSVFCVF